MTTHSPSDNTLWFLKGKVKSFKKARIFCETCGRDVDQVCHVIPNVENQSVEIMVKCHGETEVIQKRNSELQETLIVVFPRKQRVKLGEGNPKDLVIKDPQWDPRLVHLPCHCFQDPTRVCPQGKTGEDRQCHVVVEELTLLNVIHELVTNKFKLTQEDEVD